MSSSYTLFFVAFATFFPDVYSLPKFLHPRFLQPRVDNGLALTPPMGWNTYNHYSCAPNESVVHSNAVALKNLGLQDLGYRIVTIDCGWTLPDRDANGVLQVNPDRFPAGYPAMATFLHDLKLSFGVYSDGGTKMCMTGTPEQAGSLGHELLDAQTFSGWGADALKYDNCFSDEALNYPQSSYTPSVSPQKRYQDMTDALKTLAKPLLFQICEWGVDFPALWAPAMGNSYRITNDIIPSWRTVARILNQAVPQTDFSGPGHWADLDMLEVGNNIFTIPEEQTHFSLWAILKSPLTVGCALHDDLTSISKTSLAILSNKDVISFNQDSLGVSASFKRRWTEEQYELWAGPLSGGRTVVALINWADTARNLTFDLPDAGFQTAASVKNIWAGITTNNVKTSFSAKVESHGVMLLELNGTTYAGNYSNPVKDGKTYTFTDVYGKTTSTLYNATLILSTAPKTDQNITITTSTSPAKNVTILAKSTKVAFPLSLLSSATNTVKITNAGTLIPTNLTITDPAPGFFPAATWKFITGTAVIQDCKPDFCGPLAKKVSFIGPDGSSAVVIPKGPAPNSSITAVTKYLSIYFINNDIAIATSFGTGTNTRNLTLKLNDNTPVRVEVPLSGRSSELYSPMLGWGDYGIFNITLDGFGVGDGNDILSFGNLGGENGVQPAGPDLVGVSVVG